MENYYIYSVRILEPLATGYRVRERFSFSSLSDALSKVAEFNAKFFVSVTTSVYHVYPDGFHFLDHENVIFYPCGSFSFSEVNHE